MPDETSLGPTAAPTATAPETGEEVAVLTTSKGVIVLKFFPESAPNHVQSYKMLVSDGFYAGTRFHRCIPGFMVQGGDPSTKDLDNASVWGTGGPDFRLKNEFNDIPHKRGVLSMARSQDPDSAGSQFFLMVKDTPSLDRNYTAFGVVVEGMDVVDDIVGTGDPHNNGKVKTSDAVLLEKAELKTWPL